MYVYIPAQSQDAITFENNQKLMIFSKNSIVCFLLGVHVKYSVSQKWNRNPQAGGGSLTFEICMEGGSLSSCEILGSWRPDVGQNTMLICRVYQWIFLKNNHLQDYKAY